MTTFNHKIKMDKGLNNTKTVLRSLITASPNGITVQQLIKDYNEVEGTEIPHAALGFPRLDVFLHSLSDVCYLKNEGYTTKVYAIQSEASKHIDKLVKEQNKPKKTRKSTNNSSRNQSSRNGRQNNMNKNEQRSSQSSYRQVNLSSYQPMPNTISPNNNYRGYMPADAKSSSDKSSIGSERFDRSPSDKWHETQTSPDQVRFTSSVRHNDLLYNKESNAVQEISKNFREMNTYKAEHSNKKTNQCTEAVPFLKDDDEVFQVGLPEEVAKLGTRITLSKIPANVQKGSMLQIYVSEINNPFRFWFHIRNDQYELDELMDRIGTYYKSCLHGELNLPHSQTSIGQLCAVLKWGIWHRAEVVHTINNGNVKVYCIDYGTILLVPLSDLKFLLKEFCAVPSQAYRGCLAHIQPIGLRWDREASLYFLSLLPDALLKAKVEDIDYEERVLRLRLIDTNGEHDLSINDALVEKGIAKPMLSKEAEWKWNTLNS